LEKYRRPIIKPNGSPFSPATQTFSLEQYNSYEETVGEKITQQDDNFDPYQFLNLP
jgi:hypothetical protein